MSTELAAQMLAFAERVHAMEAQTARLERLEAENAKLRKENARIKTILQKLVGNVDTEDNSVENDEVSSNSTSVNVQTEQEVVKTIVQRETPPVLSNIESVPVKPSAVAVFKGTSYSTIASLNTSTSIEEDTTAWVRPKERLRLKNHAPDFDPSDKAFDIITALNGYLNTLNKSHGINYPETYELEDYNEEAFTTLKNLGVLAKKIFTVMNELSEGKDVPIKREIYLSDAIESLFGSVETSGIITTQQIQTQNGQKRDIYVFTRSAIINIKKAHGIDFYTKERRVSWLFGMYINKRFPFKH